MFFRERHGQSKAIRRGIRFFHRIKYDFIRPVLSEILFYGYYFFIYQRFEKTTEGKPLKPGISVYLPAKDEEAHLKICLESLIGIADQMILIDNGSADKTLFIMNEFKSSYAGRCDIEVHSLPDALLVETVQFAMKRIKHEWILKWDGHLLAIRSGSFTLADMKKRLLRKKRPIAYTLPIINLTGDYNHMSNFRPVTDVGEPSLRKFSNQFVFIEDFGRVENAAVPIYYRLTPIRKHYFCFHLAEIRPARRQMYRHCYLDWRETVNTGSAQAKMNFKNFEDFQRQWIFHNFQTESSLIAAFRFSRVVAAMCVPYDMNIHPLENALVREIESGKMKFNIEYMDGNPYRMVDRTDEQMLKYQPHAEDAAWNPSADLFYDDSIRLSFTKI